MSDIEINTNWNERKSRLKMKFELLTDNDLMFEEGNNDEILEKLQVRLGKSKAELQKIITAS
jgi:uncharacterized protein YjbJ (UPF0337 family)